MKVVSANNLKSGVKHLLKSGDTTLCGRWRMMQPCMYEHWRVEKVGVKANCKQCLRAHAGKEQQP